MRLLIIIFLFVSGCTHFDQMMAIKRAKYEQCMKEMGSIGGNNGFNNVVEYHYAHKECRHYLVINYHGG